MHGVGEEKVTKYYCLAAKELHTPACIFFSIVQEQKSKEKVKSLQIPRILINCI